MEFLLLPQAIALPAEVALGVVLAATVVELEAPADLFRNHIEEEQKQIGKLLVSGCIFS